MNSVNSGGVDDRVAAPVHSISRIPASWFLTAIFLLVGANHLLLWRFLGFGSFWIYAAGVAVLALTLIWTAEWRSEGEAVRIQPKIVLVSLLVSTALLILGGEGRLFYSNIDWQIRDAVLGDMARQDWPFAYTARGTPELLRAPIGMYLMPALASKVWGVGAGDFAILAQNGAFLGALLAISSVLFDTFRQRLIALSVFVFFSGMDILVPLLDWSRGLSIPEIDHIESWSGLQYSSHITQMFWVPQHALAGWTSALLYLLWRTGRCRVGLLLASVPLLCLWSPLSMIGALPLAAYAGIRTLLRRELTPRDILLPLASLTLSLPSLVYLAAGGDDVGFGLYPIRALQYGKFVAFEVAPILAAILLIGGRPRFGADTLVIVSACLLLIPLFQLGPTIDLMMRASIPALMILSLEAADAFFRSRWEGLRARCAAGGLLLILAIGAATPLLEMRRAIRLRPSPTTECNLAQAADRSVGLIRTTMSTYLAPVGSLPPLMRPTHASEVKNGPVARCWSRPWQTPR